MDNKKLVPQIRFKEFNDEWKISLASSLFKTINEKNYPNLPILAATQEYGMVTRDSIKYDINFNINNKKTYKKVSKGQFVIHLRSFQGGFAHSSINGITSPAYTVFDFKDNNHSDLFWKYIFSSDSFIKKLELITYGIRDGRSINFSEFCELKFIFPHKTEQISISNFITKYDTLILKTQIKLEKIKALKQTLLKKMFPNENSNVPEIRFKGFTEKWEKKKLGDYAYESDKTNSNNSMSIYDVLSVSKKYGLINQIEFKGRSYAGSSLKDYKIVDINDIVYTKSPLKDTPFGIIKVNTNTKGIVSTLYAVYKSRQGIYPYYIDVYFSYDNRINKFLVTLVKIGAKNSMNISNKSILNENISLPKYEEQCKIADYFYKLDKLISLYEKEIEKLTNLKKAFLKKMFI